MKRVVIFAAYDQHGRIHDYAIEYLKYLNEISDRLIYIADNQVLPSELAKLNGLAVLSSCKMHGEYDFGSYKKGYFIVKQQGLLDDADELVLCNDSCFCIGELKSIFETMQMRDCDFWGMSKSIEPLAHLQSYFLVFKRKVFTSKVFVDFLSKICHQPTFLEVVRQYELKLTSDLLNAGFKAEAFIEWTRLGNPTQFPIRNYAQGLPLIKRKVFTEIDYLQEPFTQLAQMVFKSPQLKNCIKDYFQISPYWWLFKKTLINIGRFFYHRNVYETNIKYRFFNKTLIKVYRKQKKPVF